MNQATHRLISLRSVRCRKGTIILGKPSSFREQMNRSRNTSFSRNEIPLAIFCLARAFDKIIQEETSQAGNESVEEEVV